MAVTTTQRFEVFKRDKFICQYCGRKVPDVVLECDHIHPKSDGGSDDMTNLVTACQECNRGKAAKALGSRDSPIQAENVSNQVEKMKQLRMLNEMLSEEREHEDEYLRELGAYFWNRDPNASESYTFTDEQISAVRPFSRKITVDKLKDLMDATWRKSPRHEFAYFIGCCRSFLEMRDV